MKWELGELEIMTDLGLFFHSEVYFSPISSCANRNFLSSSDPA